MDDLEVFPKSLKFSYWPSKFHLDPPHEKREATGGPMKSFAQVFLIN